MIFGPSLGNTQMSSGVPVDTGQEAVRYLCNAMQVSSSGCHMRLVPLCGSHLIYAGKVTGGVMENSVSGD